MNVWMTFCTDNFTNGAVSKGTENSIPCGNVLESSLSLAWMPAAVLMALAPGDSLMAAEVAGWPFSRVSNA